MTGGPLVAALTEALDDAAGSQRSDLACAWCLDHGLQALAAGATADDAAALLDDLRRLPPTSGFDLVRPLVALAVATVLQHASRSQPGPVPPAPARACLGGYATAVTDAEACRFAVDWAEAAWTGGGPWAAAAVTLAGLALSRALGAAAGPPLDRPAYNTAVQAARDLYLRLAAVDPPGAPDVATALAEGTETASAWGYRTADAAHLGLLVRVCRDFGRSLPPARFPGAGHLR